MSTTYGIERFEKRVPMTVAVRIVGRQRWPGVETSFTENVSSRGVRVSSIAPLAAQPNCRSRICA